MSLRIKLALALIFAALVPMLVVAGVAFVHARASAEEQAQRRMEGAKRQAEILIERQRERTALDVGLAASHLESDDAAIASLVGASLPSARETARALAEPSGLDYLEILDARGTRLSVFPAGPDIGVASEYASAPERRSVLMRVPVASPPGAAPRPTCVSRRPVHAGDESLVVVGGRAVDEELVAGLAELLGEPAAVLDPQGHAVLASDGGRSSDPALTALIPIGDEGWKLRIVSPAADVRRTRSDLVSDLAGLAPFAVLSALVLGVLLAAGISRPIRSLARRAEDITSRHEPFRVPPPRDEVRRLTVAFDRMLDSLSESAQQRIRAERIAAWQDVARRIAHEVKNPLSPIKLAVENLIRTREKAPQDFDAALKEESATILEEVESLRRLVDEFSQFARLPAPQLADCPLRPLIEQTLALFAGRIEALRVAVDTSELGGGPERVRADPEQIGRVLKNVFANALDALEPVEARRLSVRTSTIDAPNGLLAEIEVRDSGVGIPAGMQKRIFEPYVTTRAGRGGTGLGLAIAERIVSEHRGSIRAEGAPGRGAMVAIRLPVSGPKVERRESP